MMMMMEVLLGEFNGVALMKLMIMSYKEGDNDDSHGDDVVTVIMIKTTTIMMMIKIIMIIIMVSKVLL